MAGRDHFYDCIRAFAVTLVVLTHAGVLPGGSIGVSVFFCLSGFLIAQILIGLPALSLANYARFVFRRWMRVYPLYATQVVAVLLIMPLFRPDWLAAYQAGVPGMLAFLSTPYGWTGFSSGVAWTLHAEFWFYVFFPVVFFLTYRFRMLPLAVALLIAWSWRAKFLSSPLYSNDIWYTALYLDQLLYGVAAALLISAKSRIVILFRMPLFPALAIGTTIGLATIPYSPGTFWHVETSVTSFMTAIVILHYAARPFSMPDNPVAWIGRISYSIYLMHAVVADYFRVEDPEWRLKLFLIATIVLSYLTHRFIELPGIALAKRVARFRPGSVMPSPNQAVEAHT